MQLCWLFRLEWRKSLLGITILPLIQALTKCMQMCRADHFGYHLGNTQKIDPNCKRTQYYLWILLVTLPLKECGQTIILAKRLVALELSAVWAVTLTITVHCCWVFGVAGTLGLVHCRAAAKLLVLVSTLARCTSNSGDSVQNQTLTSFMYQEIRRGLVLSSL